MDFNAGNNAFVMDICEILELQDRIYDEIIAREVAHHTQQLIEKVLHEIRNKSGLEYKCTHRLEKLLEDIPVRYFTIEDYMMLKRRASIISDWNKNEMDENPVYIDVDYLSEAISLAFKLYSHIENNTLKGE